MTTDTDLLDRFHAVLVDEIRNQRPDLIEAPFTVAEIYQELVPYRTHRDRIGVEMNGDYEHLLVRLLAGEGNYLLLEAEAARHELQAELESRNPNTGLFREFAAADVRLNPERLPTGEGGGGQREDEAGATSDAGVAGDAGGVPEAGGGSNAEAPPEPALFLDDGEPTEPLPEPRGSGPDPSPPEEDGAGREDESGREDASAACSWCRGALPNRENLNYCPFCGTDVNVVPCPSCGEALEPDWRFCIACGAGVTSG